MKIYLIMASSIFLLSACDKPQNDITPQAQESPVASMAVEEKGMADAEFGLSKTSVFDIPDPQTVSFSDQFPGTSTVLPRAYYNAPPQIPHNIDSFKPITASNNSCMGCHNNPAMRGKEITKGMPTPMPESHYVDLRHKPDAVREQIVEARYVCTQCHVPQANVEVLVENTFQPEISQ